MTLFAREGDIVTCVENNHPMYVMTEDIYRSTKILPKQFEALHPKLPKPLTDERYPLCPICGSTFTVPEWWRIGVVPIHFEDGFRQ